MELLLQSNIEDATIKEYIKKDYKLNVLMRKKQAKRELVTYLHATCLSLSVTTFVRAIKNKQFLTWLGLTTNLVLKYLPKSMRIYKGQLKTEKYDLQSTKGLLLNNLMFENLTFFITSFVWYKKIKLCICIT